MNKKEYLQQYKILDDSIKSKIEELERWKCLATKITPTYSDMPKGSGGDDKIQSAVENIVALQSEINSSIDKLVDLKINIGKAINNVSDLNLRLILHYIYIDGLQLEEVACKRNYSYKQICRLHGQALQEIRCPTMSLNVL